MLGIFAEVCLAWLKLLGQVSWVQVTLCQRQLMEQVRESNMLGPLGYF